MSGTIAERAKWLRSEIDRHNRLYYVMDAPEISDARYDELMSELLEIEGSHPELAEADSPTKRVGGSPRDEFSRVVHRVPMLSLDNAFSAEDLRAFCRRTLGEWEAGELCCELKIDGLAVTLTYEDGLFRNGATRGDGNEGEDVTANLLTVHTLPLRLQREHSGLLEVRGEVFMTRKAFAALNEQREEEGQPLFANPRNAAAGSLRQLDPGVTKRRNLDIFVYQAADPEAMGAESHYEMLQMLKLAGFPVQGNEELCSSIEQVEKYIATWNEKRHTLPYATDGVVVKIDELVLRKKLGSTTRAPRWAIAWKYPPEEKQTTVSDILVSVGRTGVLTPIVVLEPVRISGSVVKRASLHNADEVKRKDVRVKDTVLVRKAGEIIPEIVKVVSRDDAAGSRPFTMPATCPVCGSAVVRLPGEAAHRCPNRSCPAQLREGLLHFASRSGMDIQGLGEKVVEALLETGTVSGLADLYSLTPDMIEDIRLAGEKNERKLGRKTAESIVRSIEASKNRPLSNLLAALGIRFAGARVAGILADNFGDIDALSAADVETLAAIEGIGPVIAASVVTFFADEANRETIEKLRSAGVQLSEEKTRNGENGPWSGVSIVFTGELERATRKEAEMVARLLGALTPSSVSSKTGWLVCGASPGSKLQKARSLGVEILDEATFWSMARQAGYRSDQASEV
ncbi:MAG: NAD-dependent DNA ligase LigA [Synergistota bacterium]|nr:NAD-dependent DNA ligase LigA [Synergistota bacterium]